MDKSPSYIPQSQLSETGSTATDRIMMEKKVTVDRWAPAYHGKFLGLFFFSQKITIFYIITFFVYNSVGWNTSIDSQFESILRGNIKL